jgi:hypothetical protein
MPKRGYLRKTVVCPLFLIIPPMTGSRPRGHSPRSERRFPGYASPDFSSVGVIVALAIHGSRDIRVSYTSSLSPSMAPATFVCPTQHRVVHWMTWRLSDRAEYWLSCRGKKNVMRFKGQARARRSGEKCGLVLEALCRYDCRWLPNLQRIRTGSVCARRSPEAAHRSGQSIVHE